MIEDLLQELSLTIASEVTLYEGNAPSESLIFVPDSSSTCKSDSLGNEWQVTSTMEPVADRADTFDFTLRALMAAGTQADATLSIRINCNNWSTSNYVLLPASAYNGNRFHSVDMEYPPAITSMEDYEGKLPIITNVPRLNVEPGPSRLQQITRDLTTPAMGIRFTDVNKGLWLLTTQGTTLGDSSFDIEESDDRNSAHLRLTAPGMRHGQRYVFCGATAPSPDKPAKFTPGTEVTLEARMVLFNAPSIQSLYDMFASVRGDMTPLPTTKNELPFSAAFEILQTKHNAENWYDDPGFYAPIVKSAENPWPWRAGWCGGLMNTLALMIDGNEQSQQRAQKTLDLILREGMSPSGLFWSCGNGHDWRGTFLPGRDTDHMHLIRRSGDALYFALKQVVYLRDEKNKQIPNAWNDALQKCADAFVTLWRENGQFGQFINPITGDIVIPGSTAGGIVPAALALAHGYFGNEEYLNVARESAQYYCDHDMANGLTTGGPAEIIQCPDSESAFGLLESLVILFETTGDKYWLSKSEEMARQAMTWCVSYDYEFPPQTLFGRLDMKAAGSVWANVQNKHSAPGICTLSGDSLFKLYRATGNTLYLEIIFQTAHNITQYLSREDRPVGTMPPGWMTERVNTSDWAEGIGEIFEGSCWCETSCLLTCVELPGLYIQTDKEIICAFDHVDIEKVDNTNDSITLRVTNPTKFNASVRVLIENDEDMSSPLLFPIHKHIHVLDLPTGKSETLTINPSARSFTIE